VFDYSIFAVGSASAWWLHGWISLDVHLVWWKSGRYSRGSGAYWQVDVLAYTS